MYKNTRYKKIILSILLFGFGINNSYCMRVPENIENKDNQQEVKQEQEEQAQNPGFWQRIKNFCYNTKEKVKNQNYISQENLSLLGFFGLFTAANIAGLYLIKLFIQRGFKDACPSVKNQVIKLAKQMKIKNPENIKVKVMNSYEYNGASDVFGHIILSKKASMKINSDKTKFIIGHELSHHKHKDALFGFIIGTISRLGLFFALHKYNVFERIRNWRRELKRDNNPERRRKEEALYQAEQDLEEEKSWWEKSFNHFKNFGIAALVADFFVNNTLGRFFEIRADFTAASLGRNVATGGINLFKGYQKTTKRLGFLYPLLKLLNWKQWITDPHPSLDTRISYLKEYRKAKYGPTLTKRIKNGGKAVLKKILKK